MTYAALLHHCCSAARRPGALQALALAPCLHPRRLGGRTPDTGRMSCARPAAAHQQANSPGQQPGDKPHAAGVGLGVTTVQRAPWWQPKGSQGVTNVNSVCTSAAHACWQPKASPSAANVDGGCISASWAVLAAQGGGSPGASLWLQLKGESEPFANMGSCVTERQAPIKHTAARLVLSLPSLPAPCCHTAAAHPSSSSTG